MGRRSKSEKDEKVGGLSFYLSLLSLVLIAFSNLSALLGQIATPLPKTLLNFGILLGTSSIGFLLTCFVVPGRTLVFMHETRHAVLSGLAGNRWKKMKINNNSGEFEYAYSKQTAHFNALIALAPYFLPLLTIPAIFVAIALAGSTHLLMVAIIGSAFGCDLYASVRDISPYQSDFSSLRGGFGIGFLYVIAANTVLITLLLAWSLWELEGLKLLLTHFWDLVGQLINAIRHSATGQRHV